MTRGNSCYGHIKIYVKFDLLHGIQQRVSQSNSTKVGIKQKWIFNGEFNGEIENILKLTVITHEDA